MDEQTSAYLQYYKAQTGGQLHTFSGTRRAQLGGGLGDILRGIWRTIFPMAARGASTFLNETLKAKNGGINWGDAAKAALLPVAKEAAAHAIEKVAAASARPPQEQSGSGRRRRKKRRHHLTHSKQHPPQTGGRRRRRGYKRAASGTQRKHTRRAKRIKFLNF